MIRPLPPLALGFLLYAMLACGPSQGAAPEVAMVSPVGEGAQRYWPQWRGPTRQGLVNGEGYPDRWSDKENVVWRVEVPGKGNSSPIIWGKQVFLTAAHDKGKRRSILAFDRKSGTKTWETFAPVDATPEGAHGKNGWASGTPACDGRRVYAYLGNHGLLAVNLDGTVAWHTPLGDIASLHGSACSPLLYGDRLIIYQDKPGDDGGFIAAFSLETGEELWRTRRQSTVGWGSPIAVRAGDREKIIVSSQGRVTAYNPNDGAELWRCRGNTVEVTPTPVVGHGLIFASSGRAGPTLAIRPGGTGDVTNTHVAWRETRGSPFIPSPLLAGDYLFLITDTMGVMTCYHAASGEVAWRSRLPAETQGEAYSASPVLVDGKLFVTRDTGETFVLRAGPEYELLHVNNVNERVLASPALVDGRWYIRTERHLMCVGPQ